MTTVFDRIKEDAPILDVIQHYYTANQIKPEGSGKYFINPCPFCGGHKGQGKGGNNSFHVKANEGLFYAFCCGEKGSVIDFVMKIKGISEPLAAAKEIAQTCHLNIDFTPPANGKSNGAPPKPPDPFLEIHKRIFNSAAEWYYKTLLASDAALKQLAKDRKFSKEFITQRKTIGYSGGKRGQLLKHLRGKGFSDEHLLKSGLICRDEKSGNIYEYFAPQYVMHFHYVDKQICYFTATYIKKKELKEGDTHKAKNNLKAEFRIGNMALYSQNDLVGQEVIFVEGQNDVEQIKNARFRECQEKKKKNPNARQITEYAVADKNFTDDGTIRKKLKYAKMVYLWYDPDQAGITFCKRFFDKFWGDFPIKVIDTRAREEGKVILGTGLDPDDYLKSANKPWQNLEDLKTESIELFNWLVKTVKESDDPYTTYQNLKPYTSRFASVKDQMLVDFAIEIIKQHFSNPIVGKIIGENIKKDRYTKEISGPTKNNLNYFEEDGVYQKATLKGPHTISNFVLRIENIVLRNDAVNYLCTLINEHGEIAEDVEFEPLQRIDKRKFSEKIAGSGRGSYYFTGDNSALSGIWQYEERRKVLNLTMMIRHYGEVRSQNLAIFDNCVIKNGIIYEKDAETGVIKVDGINYRSDGVNAYSKTKPSLNLDFECTNEFLQNVAIAFQDSLDRAPNGNLRGYQGLLLFGFVSATVYCHEISEYLTFFPHLLVYGQAESGKSSTMGLINKCFGWKRDKSYEPWDKASPAGTYQLIEQLSGMIVWYDEFRNNQNFKRMEGTVRNIFDRVGEGKGGKTGERQVTVTNGTLCISGQDIPRDEASISRSIYIRFFKEPHNEHRLKAYNYLREQKENLSAIVRKLFVEKDQKTADRICQKIDEYREHILSKNRDISDRIATCQAVPAAALSALDIDLPEDFKDYLVKQAEINLLNTMRENPVMTFFLELAYLNQEKINGECVLSECVTFQPQKGLLAIWFNVAIRKVFTSLARRSREQSFTEESFKNAILEHESLVSKLTTVKINGTGRGCMTINILKLPDELREELLSSFGADSP